jgi:hypothetical protein
VKKKPEEYLRSCLKKFSGRGEHLTSNELVATVELLEPIEHVTLYMGEQYRLFQADISSNIAYFKAYLENRGINEKKRKEIWDKIRKGY